MLDMQRESSRPQPRLNRFGLWQQEINLTIRLPLNLREDLAAAATRQGLPSSILLRRILANWLMREIARQKRHERVEAFLRLASHRKQ